MSGIGQALESVDIPHQTALKKDDRKLLSGGLRGFCQGRIKLTCLHPQHVDIRVAVTSKVQQVGWIGLQLLLQNVFQLLSIVLACRHALTGGVDMGRFLILGDGVEAASPRTESQHTGLESVGVLRLHVLIPVNQGTQRGNRGGVGGRGSRHGLDQIGAMMDSQNTGSVVSEMHNSSLEMDTERMSKDFPAF